MPEIYVHEHVVRPEEIDQLGHANNLCYLRWMLDAAVAHSDAQGWSYERYRQLGATWVVRAHRIDYLRPAYVGEKLHVRTWVAATRRVTSVRKYEIVRAADGATLAEAETDWAFVEMSTGRVTRIPPHVAEAFTVVAQP